MRKVFLGSVGLVAYAFVGYPLAVAALARLRARPPAAGDATPSVTLVIAALDEENVIAQKLENVRALDYPTELLEVVVVAEGSRDRTADVARERGATLVLDGAKRRGKASALRRGADAASGQIVAFSDANNSWSRESLRALVAPFADGSVGVVAGRKAIDDGSGAPLDRAEGLYWRYESKVREWESRAGSTTAVAGEILAVRREALRLPPDGTVNDDFVLAMLAALDGWRVVYAPDAVSLERASARLADEETRRARIVAGRALALADLLPRMLAERPFLAWQVLSHKGIRPLVPFALAAAAASNVALARRDGWARAALLGHALFYGAAAAGRADARRGRRRLALYLPYYFCRMNVASLRGLADVLRRRDLARWTRVRRAEP